MLKSSRASLYNLVLFQNFGYRGSFEFARKFRFNWSFSTKKELWNFVGIVDLQINLGRTALLIIIESSSSGTWNVSPFT